MFFLRNVIVVTLALGGLYAQSNLNQQISGQVTDATGAALPMATVTVTEQGTGLIRSAKVNPTGNYVVPDLPAGQYQVACFAPGFKKEVVNDNLLSTNVNIEVNCKMQVGSQAESISVM